MLITFLYCNTTMATKHTKLDPPPLWGFLSFPGFTIDEGLLIDECDD